MSSKDVQKKFVRYFIGLVIAIVLVLVVLLFTGRGSLA